MSQDQKIDYVEFPASDFDAIRRIGNDHEFNRLKPIRSCREITCLENGLQILGADGFAGVKFLGRVSPLQRCNNIHVVTSKGSGLVVENGTYCSEI